VSSARGDTCARHAPVKPRVLENGRVLRDCYRALAAAMQRGEAVTPAVEWLCGNFPVVEEQVREIQEGLPAANRRLVPLLIRNMAIEEDICDQLFNHSEKRLARALLKLARFGQEIPRPEGHIITPRISQDALAEMIGTTRSRVNFFMNKFRRLGLIDYNGEVHVRPELLTDVVLGD
jgi:CRP-like cAMP-binding protein